jgi:hypothetical protein
MKLSIAAAITILTLCMQSQAFGQCDYDSCSLRIKYGWSLKLVAGAEEHEIAGLGMFPSKATTEIFAERSELAASMYQDFRSQRITGSVLALGGLAMMFGGVFAAEENENLGVALVFGGLAISTAGMVVQTTAFDKVSKAIWEYNRTLSQ